MLRSGRAVAVAALSALALPSAAQAALPGRNGALIYEGAESATGVLYLRQSDGSGLRRLRIGGSVANPAFSPQGQRGAFAKLGQVWGMFADGSSPRPVTPGPTPSGSPTGSPAGDALAFARGSVGARDIYSIAADGNGLRRLTASGADEQSPAWSVAGQIAYVRRTPRVRTKKRKLRANEDIYAMAADGTRQHRLTRNVLNDRSPTWSPDGRLIAFTRGNGKQRDLYVMTSTGGRLRRLTKRGNVGAPAFSPNGRWIVFPAGHGRKHALFVMRSRGGRLQRITSFANDVRVADWQPAGADPVVAAAGDIACDPASPDFNGGLGLPRSCQELQTSNLMLRRDLAAVLPLGDIQ